MSDLQRRLFLAAGVIIGLLATCLRSEAQSPPADLDWLLPNESLKKPFAEQVPIIFVSRGLNRKEWEDLPKYWNDATEDAIDQSTGQKITRKIVKIKLPL